MLRTLLVAMDGSSHAHKALEFAVDLAKRYGASLCLLHAFPHVSDLLGHPEYDQLLEARTLIGQTLLDAARSEVGNDIAVEMQLLEGPPAQAILRVATEEAVDLIVMGSRGHGRIAGLLLGSVSTTVSQRAPCPVLIVP